VKDYANSTQHVSLVQNGHHRYHRDQNVTCPRHDIAVKQYSLTHSSSSAD